MTECGHLRIGVADVVSSSLRSRLGDLTTANRLSVMCDRVGIVSLSTLWCRRAERGGEKANAGVPAGAESTAASISSSSDGAALTRGLSTVGCEKVYGDCTGTRSTDSLGLFAITRFPLRGDRKGLRPSSDDCKVWNVVQVGTVVDMSACPSSQSTATEIEGSGTWDEDSSTGEAAETKGDEYC